MSNQLGRYTLIAEVARGGMGLVYLASSKGLAGFNKLLIIKEIRPDLVDDPTFLQMFLEEARLAARLSHPNIVQTYEIGVDGARHFIVMDYLDGVPLSQIVRQKSPRFTVEMHLRVICEALQGLHYAHTLCDFDGTPLGLVHRDVSPQNVFVTFDAQVKVVDFGIAKARDSAIETSTGVLKGKPAYMPAEQVSGDADARADVYAAGVMLWEAVARRRLWQRMGELEILSDVLSGNLPDLATVAPDAPPALVATIRKALSRNREDRHATAAELQFEVENYLATTTNASLRETAAVVAELFTEERSATRATLEVHLAALKAGALQNVPRMRAAHDLGLPSSSAFPTASSTPTSGKPPSSTMSTAAVSTGASGLASADEGTKVEVPQPPPPKGKGALVAFAAVAALLALTGVALGFRAFELRRTAAARAVAPPGDPPPPVIALPGPTSAKAAPADGSAGLPVATSPPVEASVSVATAKSATPKKPPVPWSRPVHAPPPPARRDPAASAASAEGGFLTLDTYPWTQVTLGGRALGTTPLVHLPLPAGTHTLTLDNAAENVHRVTVVVVKPGEVTSRRLAF